MKWLLARVIELKERIFLNRADIEFIKLNRELVANSRDSLPVLKLLIQMPEDYFYLVLFSTLIRELRKDHLVQIEWVNINLRVEDGGGLNFIKKFRWFDRRWNKLYLSNGGKITYRYAYRQEKIPKSTRHEGAAVFEALTRKESLLEVSYKGYELGDLIYDTYLRYKPAATVDIKDLFLKKLIISAFDNVNRLEVSISKYKPHYLLTSYCTYIQHGVTAKVALNKDVKVISFGNYDQLAKKVEKTYPSHFKDYFNYGKLFSELPESLKHNATYEAKKHLSRRFSGGVDLSTYYMSQSSFHESSGEDRFLQRSGLKKVIVFLHDFFDSPHIHREMFYADFYDWIYRTLTILKESSYEIYMKPHPNGVVGNDEVVEEIRKAFPWVRFIPKTVSNKVLIRDGFDLAVTVYGTLAHEFPYFGIPVLNAGDNPHIDFDFCIHPISREDYEYKLTHIEALPKPNMDTHRRIEEFYYMHNIHAFPGKLEVDQNSWVNNEIRGLNQGKAFGNFLVKYSKVDYRQQLDKLLYRAFREVL